MALNVDLLGPRLKLARANRHIRDLHSLFETFVGDNPHRVEVNQDPDDGDFRVIGVFERPLPNETATIIGDAIHNLRACLDHLAAEAVRVGGQQAPDRNTGFPIYLGEADFNGGIASKLKGAPAAFTELVKNLTPFKTHTNGTTGNVLLWLLGQLDNLDKHLVLLPTVSVISIPFFQFLHPDGSVMASFTNTQVGGDGKVNAIRISGDGIKAEISGEPTFSVAFKDTGLVDGEDVVKLLSALSQEVSRILAEAKKL